MKKITCDYCFEDHFFEDDTARPETCSNCHSSLAHLPVEDPLKQKTGNPLSDDFRGIRLKYRMSGELIDIPHSEIILLGRKNTGSDVLGKIPQVSREHCKIEFLDGSYRVTDLNSLNGTFLGPARRDCLKHKNQELKDGDVLYLGREPFLVTVRLLEKNETGSVGSDTGEEVVKQFKCKACGKLHEMNLAICDSCGSYGQIEPLQP